MKLKKILAIALAATTALSSGTAYNLLGGAATAEAAVDYSKAETFTVEAFFDENDEPLSYADKDEDGFYYSLEYTFEVTDAFTDKTTTDGAVKLTSVSYKDTPDNDESRDWDSNDVTTIVLPAVIREDQDPFVDDPYDYENDGWTPDEFANYSEVVYDKDGKPADIKYDNRHYRVRGIELDGATYTKLTDIKFLNAGDVKTIKLENFSDSDNGYAPVVASGSFTALTTLDYSNSPIKLEKILGFTDDAADLETLDLADATYEWTTNDNKTHTDAESLDLTGNTKLTDINLSGNAGVTGLEVAPAVSNFKATTINISNMDSLVSLKVNENYAITEPVAAGFYDLLNSASFHGVKFITDGSSDASRTLDLGNYEMNEVVVKYANLEGFVAPNFLEYKDESKTPADAKLDVSHNYIKTIDLSRSAGSAKSIDVSYNRIMELDLAGQTALKTLNASHNFLTSLDISSCVDDNDKDQLGGFDITYNYIPADNLTKAEKSGKKPKDQFKDADVMFAVTGDGGFEKSTSDSRVLAKLGGNMNLVAAIVVVGAPEGFLTKLAETVSFTEANENGGSVSLGQHSVVGEIESYQVDLLGYADTLIVSVPVTAAAEKLANEKVTLNFGGNSKNVSFATKDVSIVSYDVTSNITNDNVKTKFANQITAAMFDYPQTAIDTGKKITLAASTMDEKKTQKSGLGYKLYNATDKQNPVASQNIKVGTDKMGYKFENFNTSADGTGTSYKAGKSVAITEDTTLYAVYSEKTYNVSFKAGGGSGKADTLKDVKFGEEVTLSSASGVKKSFSKPEKHDGNFEGWVSSEDDNALKLYSDGESVKMLTSGKSDTMTALWSDDENYFITLEKNSVDLVIGDQDQYAIKVSDIDAKVKTYADQTYADNHGIDKGDEYEDSALTKKIKWYSSNKDVAEYSVNVNNAVKKKTNNALTLDSGYIYAKGAGTATIYAVVDDVAVASVSVNVMTEAQDKAKKEALATAASIDGGAVTDVSAYSESIKTVKKNADGTNTITIVKGATDDVKTLKISTITIGDTVYTVTRIGAGAYKGSKKLTTLTLSNKVKYVGKAAFANCKKLKKATLGKGLVKIGANAFKNDKKLVKVLIKSKKLTKKARVGKNAFKSTSAKAKFYIAKNAKTFKKVKKAIKAQSGVSKKATYVKKYK